MIADFPVRRRDPALLLELPDEVQDVALPFGQVLHFRVTTAIWAVTGRKSSVSARKLFALRKKISRRSSRTSFAVRSLGPFDDFERHAVAFGERAEALRR